MGRPKPQPVITAQVCSICGLPWEDHGPDAVIEECVELLKQALERARNPMQTWSGGQMINVPCSQPPLIQPIPPGSVMPFRGNLCGGDS